MEKENTCNYPDCSHDSLKQDEHVVGLCKKHFQLALFILAITGKGEELSEIQEEKAS